MKAILLSIVLLSSVSAFAEGISSEECLKRGSFRIHGSLRTATAYNILECSNDKYSSCYVYAEGNRSQGSYEDFKVLDFLGGDEVSPLNSSLMNSDNTFFVGMRSSMEEQACLDESQSMHCYKLKFDIKKKTLTFVSYGAAQQSVPAYSDTTQLACKVLK